MAQRKWRVQPRVLTRPSSLAYSLNVKYLFNASFAKRPIDLVSGWRPATANASGVIPKVWGDQGLGWGGDGGTGGYHSAAPVALTYPFTLFSYGGTANTLSAGPFIAYMLGGTGYCALTYNSNFVNTNYPQIEIDNSAGTTSIGTVSDNIINKARLAVGVFRSASDYQIYVDGVSRGTGTTNGPTLTSSFEIGIGYLDTHAFGNQIIGAEGRLLMCGALLGEMPLAAQIEISRNPWMLFAPPRKRVSVNSTSSGVSATLGKTEASDTVVSGATLPIAAGFNVLEASDTIVAGATDQVASLNATLTVTEASDTVLAGATLAIALGLNVTESSDTVLSGATLPINLGLNVTEANDVITAGATDQVAALNATASLTEASDTIVSGATLPISGSASITEASDTYAASMDTGNPAVVISTAGAGKGNRKLRILPDGNRLYASEEEVRKILETFYRKKTLDDVKLSPPKVQAKFKETPIPDVELVKFDKYVPKLYTLKTEKRMVQADYSLYLKSLKLREEENKFLSMILEMI